MNRTSFSFAPLAAAGRGPLRLAMQRLWLGGRILPAGARLVVEHVFRSAEEKPLEVIYSFMLPRDAALRSFRITGEGFEAHSELRPVEEAVKAYEGGLASGSLSTLARQYGDGIVNLNVGNVRPGETVTVHLELLAGVELRDDGFRFRFPFTLAPGYHAQMRAAEVDGEGEMELPADQFGDVILPRFREDASSLHEVGFDLMLVLQGAIQEVGSPSHAIRVREGTRVMLAPEKDVPNRDLVLDVRFSSQTAQVLSGPVADGRGSFAAIVPSPLFGAAEARPRRIAILLDRSGSMQGACLDQARKAIEACLSVLGEGDSFSLVAFDDRVERMRDSLLPATRANRDRARTFLEAIDARGGTELARGVQNAAELLDGGGDLLVLTDGQVMGTEQVLAQARASGLRLFCLGIGSASQDRFLTLLARETGGISRFVTPGERVDLAAVDLFASIGQAVASGVHVSPAAQPEPPQAVFAGSPLLLFGEYAPGTDQFVQLTWDGGRLDVPIPAGDAATGETVRLLQGSRLIADWESRYPAEEALAPLERRKQSRVAARLAELSATFGLASREMALVAVVKRTGDRPGELPQTRVVPVGMPKDTRFKAYFPAAGAAVMAQAAQPRWSFGLFRASAAIDAQPALTMMAGGILPRQPADPLVELAAAIEPDGGMPGATPAERTARSLAALFAFTNAGHTPTNGAFRSHVTRLVNFLRSAGGLTERDAKLRDQGLTAALTGKAIAGDWAKVAASPAVTWEQVEVS